MTNWKELGQFAVLAIMTGQVLDMALTYFGIFHLGFHEANPIMARHIMNVPATIVIKVGFGLLAATVMYLTYTRLLAKSRIANRFPVASILFTIPVVFVSILPIYLNTFTIFIHYLGLWFNV